ncbi:sodium-independent sulfate anion transporter-like [Bradysia coprophila]|uniref:sodium-independent sulfate anion transporter-like n=1 Tax=Bradysia coprophila TaxID=38358 RepID=UPI00187D7AAA|nr:sodium-independent sulfate anion transporter-like [Bradysia coprophila]
MSVININSSSKDLIEKDDQDHNSYKEEWPDIKGAFSRQMQTLCTTKTVIDRFPIIALARNYKLSYLYDDIVAGISVGLTAIPQSIAYAAIAGIDTKYGLNASVVACFLLTIFGSGVELCIGPTAIMSLMIQKYVAEIPEFAVFIAFILGIIVLVLVALNLAFLTQFISIPVIAGFTTAAAVTIACGQVKPLFGMPGRSSEFIETIEDFIHDINTIKLWDSVLGVALIIFILVLWKLKDVKGRFAPLCKYISLGRNALAVLIGTLFAFFLTTEDTDPPFALTGRVDTGLPQIAVPPFSVVKNENETLNFFDMLESVGPGFITITLIGVIEVVAVSKAFANGRYVNVNQELIALGLLNIFGSFLQAMPVTGLFSRTAINKASGCRTTLSSAITGVMVLIAVTFLTEAFRFIPKAALAAVLIAAMILMVEFKEAYHIWKTKRVDVIPFVVTLVVCLTFSLEYGILIGVGVNLMFIIYASSRPQVRVNELIIDGKVVLHVEPDRSLPFSAAEYLKLKITKKTIDSPDINIVVLDGRYVKTIDVTLAENLQTCRKDLNINKKSLVFWNWGRQPTNLAWRLDNKFGKCFYQSETIEDLIAMISAENDKVK